MPKSSRRETEASSEKMEEGRMGQNHSDDLLNTIDKSLEDMRTIITCRVCVRPLYEPFTIECGHTFCYTCLIGWFEKNFANKTCPDCRAKVTRKPAPAYLIREITQLFSTRAELLPAGETTQEHQDLQREEAQVLEEDRRGRGLFRGCFRYDRRRSINLETHVIIDDEDGVSRCPRCAWEVDDGECAGCGWPRETESWDDDSVVSLMAAEEVLMHQDMDDTIPFGATGSDLNDTDQSDERDDSNESDDIDDSDDESVGSLDEFVVNDEQGRGGRHGSRLTRRQLEWRFPRMESRESTGGSAATLSSSMRDIRRQSEIDADSADGSSVNETDTDAASQSQSSRYVDNTSNHHNRRSSDTIQVNPTMVDISDDGDIIGFSTRARNNRRLRPQEDNVIDESRHQFSSGSFQPQVFHITSDSDESITLPRVRRRRNAQDSTPQNHGIHGSLRNGNDNRAALFEIRSVEESLPPGQAQTAGGGADRSRIVDMDTDEDDAALVEPADSESHRNDRPSRSGLDPITSVPVRRENVNMPGAFPPSFVSEQGQSQSQSTPLVNVQDLASPPSQRQTSATRQARQLQGHDSTFLDRRRYEERTYAMQADQSHRRDRSAQKSARRQDRQRVKAEQEARGRRNGEPSIPPLTAP